MDNKISILCVVALTDIKPLHEIDAQLPAHVEWLKKIMPMAFCWLQSETFHAQDA